MNVTPRLLQLLHQLIGGGGRCHLVDLLLQDHPDIFYLVEVRAVPWPHSFPPEAWEVLLAPLLRFLGRVRWSSVLHEDGLAGVGHQRALKNPAILGSPAVASKHWLARMFVR